MVAASVSGNTGPALLIGSKVIQDRSPDESVWNEKIPQIQCLRPDQTQTGCPVCLGRPIE